MIVHWLALHPQFLVLINALQSFNNCFLSMLLCWKIYSYNNKTNRCEMRCLFNVFSWIKIKFNLFDQTNMFIFIRKVNVNTIYFGLFAFPTADLSSVFYQVAKLPF